MPLAQKAVNCEDGKNKPPLLSVRAVCSLVRSLLGVPKMHAYGISVTALLASALVRSLGGLSPSSG